MSYDLKFWSEMGWAAVIAAVVQLLTVLVGFNPDAVKDWRAWTVALGAGLVRAAAGAAIAYFGAGRLAPPRG